MKNTCSHGNFLNLVRCALQLTLCQYYIHLPTDGGIFISQTVVQPNKTLTIRYSLPQQTALQPTKSAICKLLL